MGLMGIWHAKYPFVLKHWLKVLMFQHYAMLCREQYRLLLISATNATGSWEFLLSRLWRKPSATEDIECPSCMIVAACCMNRQQQKLRSTSWICFNFVGPSQRQLSFFVSKETVKCTQPLGCIVYMNTHELFICAYWKYTQLQVWSCRRD
jgi:hypothetical protein